MVEELFIKGYDSDPLKLFMKSQLAEDQLPSAEEENKGPDYEYLLGMPMWNLTQDKMEEIDETRKDKESELVTLSKASAKQLWEGDLDQFAVQLNEFEKHTKPPSADVKTHSSVHDARRDGISDSEKRKGTEEYEGSKTKKRKKDNP